MKQLNWNLLSINIIGLTIIALIIYWFWIYKPKAVAVKPQSIIKVIVADGVYQPSHIKVPAATDVTLEFQRIDPAPCADRVIFPELNISESLPLNQSKTIKLTKLKPGHYQFHCQMQMYQGELQVES